MKGVESYMFYVIVVDYYMYSEEKGMYTEPAYLGLEGEHKLFVFDEQIVNRTKTFNTAKDAGEYVDKHFSKQSCCFEK